MIDFFLRYLGILLPLSLLLITYFLGSWLEARHFRSVRRREEHYQSFPVVSFEAIPAGWVPTHSGLVQGSVVVSVDYFKRFLASLRALFGGRIKSYEPILDRARREAVLRMTEDAIAQGYDCVLNARLETSRLASAARGGKGTAGVEMLAFGTGVKLVR